MSTNPNGYATNPNGYAKRARCGAYHSGNHGLVPTPSSQYWQCQGCGTFYSAAAVKHPSDGELGSGGVIRR